jgi:hypothetical protein
MAASLAGLSQIKKGFCFDAAGDSDFALGWPHVRRVTDESVEYHRVAAQRLMDADFDLAIHWPRDVAAALVHAWGGGQLFELTPGNRAFRLSALEAFWNSETPDREQVEAYIGERLGRAPLWSSKRATESFVLMLEALTSTEWVAEAIVGHLEGMSLSQLHESATQPAWITFQLGYLLLRLPEAKAEALRVRMRKVITEQAAIYPGSILRVQDQPSHVRSLALVLDGAAAADQSTDKGVRWYTHAVADPKTVKMRVSLHKGGGSPDVRLAWIAGAEVLSRPLFQRWTQLQPRDLRWFFESVAPIQHERVVEIMAAMLGTGQRTRAIEWLQKHSAYAKPLLQPMADERKEARAALEFL